MPRYSLKVGSPFTSFRVVTKLCLPFIASRGQSSSPHLANQNPPVLLSASQSQQTRDSSIQWQQQQWRSVQPMGELSHSHAPVKCSSAVILLVVGHSSPVMLLVRRSCICSSWHEFIHQIHSDNRFTCINPMSDAEPTSIPACSRSDSELQNNRL